ncbi:MAG: NADH-quinone oxidoreductase subunit M [Ardenticatenaceae bacterium]|nr:NADH-quinone oxidoreductase subunit M [Ardenticatenaceae bacterium]
MILFWLIVSLLIGGLVAWLAGRWSPIWPRWISLFTLSLHLIALLVLWVQYLGQGGLSGQGPWLIQLDLPWIPQWGISFHLALDGLSLLLILLTNFLGIMAVAASWAGIQDRVGFFHFNLLWILAAIVGVFLAMDLFLFYFFWEMMLVPLYFLIGIWGHENRVYATLKFFIFTQSSSLLMLLAILGLYFVHGSGTGVYTFNYFQLLDTSMAPSLALWLMLGFFVAFAVKLPVVPLHTWLPDAHTEAPTAGSVDLAGLVLKVGAYGFLRFVIPLFPKIALSFAPVAMALGVIGIIYGALVAFSQTDLKRLVAYTSISHMGFVLLGIFAWNQLALQGAVIVMLAHGISTGALFIWVGDLQNRMHTRDINRMGGLWATAPRIGGEGLLFALASLGLPGLGNFVGEFLVLLGTYQVNVPMAVLATLGFIVSTVYSLWMIQRTFFGPNEEGWALTDSTGREMAIMAAMIATTLWLGLYPQPVLTTARRALETLQQYAGGSRQAARPAQGSGAVQPGDSGTVQVKPSRGGSYDSR